MSRVVVTGTGLFTPDGGVSNDELVASLTTATLRWNAEHAAEIERGELAERDVPSSKFILRASGVGHRYVIDKQGVLDPTRLRPRIRKRGEDELSLQAEIAVAAAAGGPRPGRSSRAATSMRSSSAARTCSARTPRSRSRSRRRSGPGASPTT